MTPVTGAEALNQRIYSDGQTKNSKQDAFSTFLAVSTLLIYTGWMHILLGLIILSFYSRTACVILLLLFLTLALPPKPVLWHAFCQGYAFRAWREYFRFSYLFEEHLDPKKRYVFVEFPHGVFPLGPLLGATAGQVMFPGINIYSLAATSVFSIPFWRHFIAWLGCVPATSENFKRLLKKGSVAVIVGGIAEMYMQHPTREQIKLKDRKGFARVAVEAGADAIIPIYHFGNSKVLDFYPQRWSKLSRRLRASLGFMYGRLGLPLPRREDIFMVCGKPIPVRQVSKTDPAFESTVDDVHGKVVATLQKLYDDHKKEYGWGDRPLDIC